MWNLLWKKFSRFNECWIYCGDYKIVESNSCLKKNVLFIEISSKNLQVCSENFFYVNIIIRGMCLSLRDIRELIKKTIHYRKFFKFLLGSDSMFDFYNQN